MPKFRFIDLFAGIGGFHVALEALGGECVFAAELKPHLRTLYRENFRIDPAGDIRKVVPSEVPEHDVLCAGFPCQPFSKAGDQRGFECSTQGDLFFNVAAILAEKRPSYLILENVTNLLSHDSGRTFARIKDVLEGIGYAVKATKLSPHQFGVPQIRERVYIVGSLGGLDDFHWPAFSPKKATVHDILDTRPSAARQFTPQVADCLDTWEQFLRRMPAEVSFPSCPIWAMEFGATYPFEDTTPFALVQAQGVQALRLVRGSLGTSLANVGPDSWSSELPSHAREQKAEFPKWKKNIIRKNREFYAENKEWIDPWLPALQAFPSSLQKLEWNVGDGERSIWHYILQFRASGLRVKRPTTVPCLIALVGTQIPIIAWEKRYITPEECARLQSMPSIRLPSAPRQALQALGNAVNADVAKSVAGALLTEVLSKRGGRPAARTRQPKQKK